MADWSSPMRRAARAGVTGEWLADALRRIPVGLGQERGAPLDPVGRHAHAGAL